MNKQSGDFQDYKINIRLVLSAIWTSVMFCYIYCDYFELYVPGKAAGLTTGVNLLDSPLKLFAASFLLATPAVLIFFSLILNPGLARLLNLIFAAFYTALMVLVGLTSISSWTAFYVFFALIESLMTALIFWKALHWPRSKGDKPLLN